MHICISFKHKYGHHDIISSILICNPKKAMCSSSFVVVAKQYEAASLVYIKFQRRIHLLCIHPKPSRWLFSWLFLPLIYFEWNSKPSIQSCQPGRNAEVMLIQKDALNRLNKKVIIIHSFHFLASQFLEAFQSLQFLWVLRERDESIVQTLNGDTLSFEFHMRCLRFDAFIMELG